jgi:hypothetical protein
MNLSGLHRIHGNGIHKHRTIHSYRLHTCHDHCRNAGNGCLGVVFCTGDEACLVLATGPGNPPAVQVRTAKTVQFSSKLVQKPDLLHLGRPNPDPYPSTRGFCQVWLHLAVPISGSGIRVVLSIVAFRYAIANHNIFTLVDRCPFLMYWQPL